MRLLPGIALLSAAFLPGCYRQPPTAAIMVDTAPPGASCVISQQGNPLGIAEPTPAIVTATLTGADIDVVCRRPGFAEAAVRVPAPPPPGMPGFVPRRRPEIDYRTRVDITLVPALAADTR
jgi:hypothetical protein